MTDGTDEMPWSPLQFANQLQQASQEMTAQQMQAFNQLLSGEPTTPQSGVGGADFESMGMRMAMFKTRVQSGGRISIPDAEREVLGIDDGDIVQTFVIPINQPASDSNE